MQNCHSQIAGKKKKQIFAKQRHSPQIFGSITHTIILPKYRVFYKVIGYPTLSFYPHFLTNTHSMNTRHHARCPILPKLEFSFPTLLPLANERVNSPSRKFHLPASPATSENCTPNAVFSFYPQEKLHAAPSLQNQAHPQNPIFHSRQKLKFLLLAETSSRPFFQNSQERLFQKQPSPKIPFLANFMEITRDLILNFSFSMKTSTSPNSIFSPAKIFWACNIFGGFWPRCCKSSFFVT